MSRGPAHERSERALFEQLRDGDTSARDELALRYLPLARKLARGYRGGGDADDLEQVAAIGLLKAIDRFDPDRGLAFSTFAFPTILGELKRHFRDRGWTVRVPRSLQELALRIERVSAELTASLGRAPTVAELAERTGAGAEAIVEALEAATARHPDSLDQSRELDDERPRATGRELAVDEPGFARVDDAELLGGLLRVLAPRDRRIVELRFREDLLQSQIAARVGLSQMQISRSLRNSVELLRQTASS